MQVLKFSFPSFLKDHQYKNLQFLNFLPGKIDRDGFSHKSYFFGFKIFFY